MEAWDAPASGMNQSKVMKVVALLRHLVLVGAKMRRLKYRQQEKKGEGTNYGKNTDQEA